MAYPVKPFSLCLVHLHLSPPISNAFHESTGKKPGLFGQFNNCQANKFQEANGRYHLSSSFALRGQAGSMKRPKASFQFFDTNRERITHVNVRHPAAKIQSRAKVRLRSSHD